MRTDRRPMHRSDIDAELRRKQARKASARANVGRRSPILPVLLAVFVFTLIYVVSSGVNTFMNYRNNDMMISNQRLAGEVESLRIEQEMAANVSAIENIAKSELNMVYPTGRQFVKIRPGSEVASTFTDDMRKNAF